MSSTSLVESEVSVSDLNELACELSRSAKLSPSADLSLPDTGPMSPATTTCAPSRVPGWQQMELLPTLSAEAFHARTSPSPEKAKGLTVLEAVSGSNTLALSKKSDPFSSSLRMCLAFELSGLTECSLTWKNLGTPGKRSWWVLSMPAHRINDSGPGLLPTPSAVNYGSNQGGAAGRVGPKRHSLRSMARNGLWPTIRASDSEKGGRGDLLASIRGYKTQRAHWPTPTANRWSGLQSHGRNAVLGTLNPTWVEWLMGFPLFWLKTSSERSEMQSSLKSPNSSVEQS
jgi:hypothetical protein